MIRFIIAAILFIASIIGVSLGMHFVWAIFMSVIGLVMVAWRLTEMEELYLVN